MGPDALPQGVPPGLTLTLTLTLTLALALALTITLTLPLALTRSYVKLLRADAGFIPGGTTEVARCY